MTILPFARAAAFVSALGLAFGQAATAVAGCDFNVATAKGVDLDMVRAFKSCPGTEVPGLVAEGGAPACTPVVPGESWWDTETTFYKFGPKGRCRGRASSEIVSDCSTVTGQDGMPLGLDANPCHVFTVRADCRGILSSDGVTPISASDDGWTLHMLMRASIEDPSGGEMTVIDVPVSFQFGRPHDGRLSLRGTSAEALLPFVGIHDADIPPCANIEFNYFGIYDPRRLVFARPGVATHP